MRRHAALLALALLLAGAGAPHAQETPEEPSASDLGVVLQADSLRYDQENGIVIASGNVEMAHEGRILQADTVTYNEPQDLVIASGNVVLVETSGEVMFSEYAELTGDLAEGVVEGMQVLLGDNGRFAANGARRTGGRVTEMSKAVYSSCDLCADDPTAAPLWQIKADRVVHDQTLHDIMYYDATLEVYGFPVAYAPYLRTPDPTVERRSGFLTPTFGSSSTLGATVQIPYYFNLAPNRDATFAPLITSDEGVVAIGQYRAMTTTGLYDLNGSLTWSAPEGPNGEETDDDQLRGHFKGDGLWHYDSTWQYGFNIYRSTDDTYLSRYDLDQADTLTSDLFVEGFRGRSYASIFGYSFQSLTPSDDSGPIPVVAPLIDYQLVTEPDEYGGFMTLETNAVGLTRNGGTDSYRFTAEASWERPWVTDGGHVLTFRAQLRGDAYQVSEVPVPGQVEEFSGFIGRAIPLGMVEWRYPMVRDSATTQQLFEPIVQSIISPNTGNDPRIPNEDSQEFEFDEINLFSTNRFPGYDQVEGGFRVNYGLRMGVLGNSGGRSELLVGQSWRDHIDNTFSPETGLDEHFSDFVGRVLVSPASYFDLAYRFRIDREDYAIRRSEVGFGLGPEWLRLDTSYVLLDEEPINVVDTDSERQQIAFAGYYEYDDTWSFEGVWRQDLTGNGTVNYGASVVFENECVAIIGSGERRFTDDNFAVPETIFLLSVKLKTLG